VERGNAATTIRAGARVRVGVFLALLLVPLLPPAAGLPEWAPLAGVEQEIGREALTARSWWSGAFQQSFEAWFARRLPLRAHLVRTDNQANLSLFGRVRTGGTAISIGRENWLYEQVYVRPYNRPARTDPAGVEENVGALRRLRDLLERRGVALVLVIAPSKAEIYPEYLTPELTRGRIARRSPYELMAPRLAAAGLDLVDGHRLFLEERARGGALLFARGGTHWNHYGASLVVGRILAALERRRPGRFVQLQLRGARVDDEVWSTDNDLGELLNVWHRAPFRGPQTHPVLERAAAGRELPRLLFVGDSFSLTLATIMEEERLARPSDVLYYFKRRLRYPGPASAPLAGARFDAAREVAGLDAVVIVTSETTLPRVGFGFVPAAVAGLAAAGDPPGRARSPGD
jgi:hypothetical protein